MSFAQLFVAIPMEKVKEALCFAGANDKRERDLPAKYMAYFVMAMGLYSDSSSVEVFRKLVETLKNAFGPNVPLKIPAKSSLTYARERLGVDSLKYLFSQVVKPSAKPGETIGAFFKSWRLVTIDANIFHIADTVENEAKFGRAKPGKAPAPYPAIRCVGLVEAGTKVLFDYEIGPSAGPNNASEKCLATRLLPRLKTDQLCIADRLYGNYALWSIALRTGAKLLWRVQSNITLNCIKVLDDGSYMALLYEGDSSRSKTFVEVRVIEYTVGKEAYRLITNLSVPEATNDDLARLYHERWEHETANREQKSVLNAHIEPSGVRRHCWLSKN